MRQLTEYTRIVGPEVVAALFERARPLYGKRLLQVNSTFVGGGVAEKLGSIVPLQNDMGLVADWRLLRGEPRFFNVTKKMHNALQGEDVTFSDEEKALYLDTNRDFPGYAHIDADLVVIHDPQPAALSLFFRREQPWIWRCHVDLSQPNPELWSFLEEFVIRYNRVVVSNEAYRRTDLPVHQHVIPPAIDPLTTKNMPLSDEQVQEVLAQYDVPMDKPLLVQISRFDKWKDPAGVVDVFERVKQEVDCRLVIMGGMAADDPEGAHILADVEVKAKDLLAAGEMCLITSENSLLVNALQRAAAVVIQKSLREGFGLTVTEAMWKRTPVVASNVGGIPLQIEDGVSGFLVQPHDVEGFARRIVEIMRDPELGKRLGAAAREHVRENFLITRLLMDWLAVFAELV